MRPTTTLSRVRDLSPCKSRWRLALRKAGGIRKYGADTPITVRQIVETVGLNDALWCLRTMPEHNNLWQLFAVSCARRVQHLMTDPRSVAALDVAERYARGKATDEDLAAARAASRAASIAASSDAAWAAERAWQAAELIRICEEIEP